MEVSPIVYSNQLVSGSVLGRITSGANRFAWTDTVSHFVIQSCGS